MFMLKSFFFCYDDLKLGRIKTLCMESDWILCRVSTLHVSLSKLLNLNLKETKKWHLKNIKNKVLFVLSKGLSYQLQSDFFLCWNIPRWYKKSWWICYCQAMNDQLQSDKKTEGFMKLIKSFSDIAVRSCVVGENGWVIVVDGALTGAALIKFPWEASRACCLGKLKSLKAYFEYIQFVSYLHIHFFLLHHILH